MRLVTYILALTVSITSALAVPTPEAYVVSPTLFSKDPFSLHRRSTPSQHRRDEPETSRLELSEEESTGEIEMEHCSEECGLIRVEGVKNEREALCSTIGLEATRVCAECIDTAWPHARFQKSAMSEYEKIFRSCKE